MKQGRSSSKEFKISSSSFWREESCNKNCKLFYLNICHLCFLYFAARTCQGFHSFQNFHRLCNRLCCVVIGCLSFFCFMIGCSEQCDYRLKQYDYRPKIVRSLTQNSTVTAELLFLGTNHNAGITSDFKMDIII